MAEWMQLCLGYRPAIPALSLFNESVIDAALAQSLASIGYRFKNGESLSLTIPTQDPSYLKHCAKYLHAMRMEALQGLCYASWFNGVRLNTLTDLLIWTRVNRQYHLLSEEASIHAQAVHVRSIVTMQSHAQHRRTLLCQSGPGLTDAFESLHLYAKPFAVVVDLTAFGHHQDIPELMDHLRSYYPDTPVLHLLSLGDLDVHQTLSSHFSGVAHWIQHAHDATPIVRHTHNTPHVSLVECPDTHLNSRLIVCAQLCRELKNELDKYRSIRDKSVRVLYSVLSRLRQLVIDIEEYEQQLDRKRQAGPFSIRPLRELLHGVARISMPTGQAANLTEQITQQLLALMDSLQNGVTGKTQALRKWLHQHDNTDDSLLIVLPSSREAGYLTVALTLTYPNQLAAGRLRIMGVSSVLDRYRLLETPPDHVLIIGQLWSSDYFVFFVGQSVTWLAYPAEIPWFRKVGRQLQALIQASDRNKTAWWELAPCPPETDSLKLAPLAETAWTDCTGQYKIKQVVTFDIPHDPDYLVKLMADIIEQIDTQPVIGTPQPGEITLETDTGVQRRYGQHQQIYIIHAHKSEDAFDRVLARDIQCGDFLIILDDDNGEIPSLIDLVIDHIKDNARDYRLSKTLVDQWFTYVDSAIQRLGSVDRLHTHLLQAGIRIGIESVRRWSFHIGIAPREKNSIVPAVMRAANPKCSKADCNTIIHAQSHIMGLHNLIGKEIRRITASTGSDQVAVTGSASTLLDQQALSRLIHLEEVIKIKHHDHASETKTKLTLAIVLRDIVDRSHGRLVATPAAYKSAEDSPFQDLDRVRICLRLLQNDYYDVYSGAGRLTLEEAISHGKPHQIIFRGNTSDITKGLHASMYFKTYNGKKVDIGKHLGIGDSFSPERCFRLYFHFDDDNQQIVIHHAGRHLPTSSG